MKTIEQPIFNLVTFEQPIKGSKIWRKWICVIGGIEFSGNGRDELRQKAIKILQDEIKRLKEIE